MSKILLWAHLNIMPSAETILVIDGPMCYSCNLAQDIASISGPMHWSPFWPIRCFRISTDAILLVIFAQSAEICWLNVIGHLYMSGLAMLLEILTEWVGPVTSTATVLILKNIQVASQARPMISQQIFHWEVKSIKYYWSAEVQVNQMKALHMHSRGCSSCQISGMGM